MSKQSIDKWLTQLRAENPMKNVTLKDILNKNKFQEFIIKELDKVKQESAK